MMTREEVRKLRDDIHKVEFIFKKRNVRHACMIYGAFSTKLYDRYIFSLTPYKQAVEGKKQAFLNALSKLDDTESEMLKLYVIEHKSLTEIADIMCYSVSAISRKLPKAIRKLRIKSNDQREK